MSPLPLGYSQLSILNKIIAASIVIKSSKIEMPGDSGSHTMTNYPNTPPP